MPMKVWMREDLRDFVTDHLTSSPATERGLYRRQAVANLLDDHFTGRIDASNKIFALLMLELWYRRFADRRSELLAEGPHR
ncbi:MAG: asparagine synthase-related protein [Stellaceae bacterium]